MSSQKIRIRRVHLVLASVLATAYWSINTYSSWGALGVNAMWMSPIAAGFIANYAFTNGKQFHNTVPYVAGAIVLEFFQVGYIFSIHPLLAILYFFVCTMIVYLALVIASGWLSKYLLITD